MNVEDIASQIGVVFETWYTARLKRHNFRVHVNVSAGSTETLVRRGGQTNHHLIAYSVSNISAQNYQNRLMCVEVIIIIIIIINNAYDGGAITFLLQDHFAISDTMVIACNVSFVILRQCSSSQAISCSDGFLQQSSDWWEGCLWNNL